MANFNFKKAAKVYIRYPVSTGTIYRLDVQDITFSQTFTDKTYPQKTLHHQHKLHQASSIKKANPANFEFTIPALTQSDSWNKIVLDLLVDFKSGEYNLNTFDLWIIGTDTPDSGTNAYKLNDCVITNGTFIIEKLENLKLTVSGQASKLVPYGSVGSAGSTHAGILRSGTDLPTGVTADSAWTSRTRTFQKADYLNISIGGVDIPAVTNVSVELQNDVKWNPYETVNDALNVTNAATSMYPSNFTLQKRTLSGSIAAYVEGDGAATGNIGDKHIHTWGTGQTLTIKAGASASLGFQFNLLNCSYTNRINAGDIFTQHYDWKMNDNPTDLGDASATDRSYITLST